MGFWRAGGLRCRILRFGFCVRPEGLVAFFWVFYHLGFGDVEVRDGGGEDVIGFYLGGFLFEVFDSFLHGFYDLMRQIQILEQIFEFDEIDFLFKLLNFQKFFFNFFFPQSIFIG